MDVNLMYAILGIISTIVVSYIVYIYSIKYNVKTSILFFENSCISLFETVVKELNELEIKYEGKVVNENLISYKGTFFNSGNVDIDKNLIYKPLSIILPPNYEWKKVKIIDKSNELDIEVVENINRITFSWDIFKENEFFTFDSVIEFKPNDNKKPSSSSVSITRQLSKNIKFDRRITNLKSINKEKIPKKPVNYSGLVVTNIYILGFFLLGLFGSIGQFIFPNYTITHEAKLDSSILFVNLENVGKEKIQLIDSLGNVYAIKDISKFNNKVLTGKIRIEKNKLNYISFIIGILTALFSLIFFIYYNKKYINNKKLYKQLKEIADKYNYHYEGLFFNF